MPIVAVDSNNCVATA